jgi:ferredoxin-NADP reductase
MSISPPKIEYKFPLKERFNVARGTMAFVFDTSPAPDFAFRAGQYIEAFLESPAYMDERGGERHFSISSSPNDKGIIMIATRMGGPEPSSGKFRISAFKKILGEMPLGTLVRVKGPRGAFTLHENPSKKAVFIAGGIGITPCRSIMKYANEGKLPHQITLIYSNRNPASTAFQGDLEKWARENPNFKLFLKMTDETGFLDAKYVKETLGDFSDTIFYVVGPPGMVKTITQILEGLGISRDDIRFEEFTGYQ